MLAALSRLRLVAQNGRCTGPDYVCSCGAARKAVVEKQTGKKDAGQIRTKLRLLASTCIAALPSALPTFRFGRESRGMDDQENTRQNNPRHDVLRGLLGRQTHRRFASDISSQGEKASTDNLQR